ncbi:MAG TPA: hypothetical protein PK186_00175 [candidate division Zixibacteria bacterium]|nr:hypothetical protein [candidate division Zixibacteria bacterium]MDD4918899.1 hypothetical protein [candidate division Zixibacteria bacterium]MDM7972246.1 hypothetical protein [candidate division Zixibacteria bacterium]HOD67360.1 hypothetical protein [candidate division Zixibacteria bacterium]HPM35956.1 hypothetical protein [candidate division Zixibacteria bacterium]
MILRCPQCHSIHDFTPAASYIKQMLRDGHLIVRCRRCGLGLVPMPQVMPPAGRRRRRRRLRDINVPINRLSLLYELMDPSFGDFITKAWGNHPRPFTTHQ